MHHFTRAGFTAAFCVRGAGDPLVLLHGNTGSSVMLEAEVEYYSRFFRVVGLDLIGHGSAPRCRELPDDFWRTNARVVTALCEHLSLTPARVAGTSGGAIVALNMAIDAPEHVHSVVADSFMGQSLTVERAEAISREREEAKRGPARGFWTAMHGADWEAVVDADTRMLMRFARAGGSFFGGRLSEAGCPVLLTASLEDELIPDPREVVSELARALPHAQQEIFASGGHPAMLSNAARFRSVVMQFFARNG